MLSFSRRRTDREAAGRLYEACLAASRRPALYLSYGVPDTLQGRFEMLALALFPLLDRLMHGPGDDPGLARFVSERFVEDMDAVFREMGVSDPAMPKRMKTLYGSFAGRMTAYAEALAQGEGRLSAAIARNVFPGEAPDGRSDRLAAYLVMAAEAVRATDLSEIRGGGVPFPELAPAKAEPSA